MQRKNAINHEKTRDDEMIRREQEEKFLMDLMLELALGDEDYWREKTREWANDPDRKPTPEQIADFEKRLEREVRQIQEQKRQEARAKAQRRKRRLCTLRKVAMILVFLCVFAGSTLYCTVDAFAAGVDRFIATVMPMAGAEELRIEEKKDAGLELDMADYAGMYVPNWLPKGYIASEIISEANWRKILYRNGEQDVICFEIAKKTYSVIVDDEDVVEEKVYLHDGQGRVFTTEEQVCVVWEDDGYLYTVSGKQLLRDELLEIAEKSIKIKVED